MVKVTVDGIDVEVPEGAPVLAACKRAGKIVPTLCDLKGVNNIGSCRVCVVEIEGEERLAASCNTPAEEGMVIHTDTPAVIEARRTNVALLLAEHRTACTSCKRNDTCALRQLSEQMNIEELPYALEPEMQDWDPNLVLQRDNSKCIKCMRCVAFCDKVQQCSVWEPTGTGSHLHVTVRDGRSIREGGCSLCGQCITHCPTGALTVRDDTVRVLQAIKDPEVMCVVQTAPAVRAAWGEGIGLTREEATQGRMVSALRKLGFDTVYDTDFAADLTIMEEGSEFLEHIKGPNAGAMFTSCCPGWVRFAKLHHPEIVSRLSSAKSPHQMLGAVIKNHMAAEAEAAGKRLFTVSIMPCTAKKYEAGVPELSTEGGADVDAVLTVREFDRMIRSAMINPQTLEEDEFDAPLGMSTGAGTIFGRTGGVMEAALRTAAALLTGEAPDLDTLDLREATPEKPWIAKTLNVAGRELNIAVASGLSNTEKLLAAMESGEVAYDFVEIMACPGGCVGGGGQPILFNREQGKDRAVILNTLDHADTLRMSHENPQIQQLYKEYLGEPLSHLAHELLHTDQEEWSI